MNLRPTLLPALLLVSLLACGGGSSSNGPTAPTVATRLAYTDPTTGTYLLKQNTSLSSGTHLVLEVWGPASDSACGVSVSFSLSGSAAAWRNVNASDAANTYVANGTAFDLGTGAPILKATVSGTTLVAAVAEKGVASPKALNKALLRVALDLQSGVTPGTAIQVTPNATGCQLLTSSGGRTPITITAGSLTAQ